jgi:curved DNA-binding protein CbpA
MNQYDALKVLGLSGEVSPEQIKLAYKKACSKFHPDRNPAGLEIMKMVNVAYEVLKSYDGKATVTSESAQYGDEVAEALNAISVLGLFIEICGAWVWVSGNTKDHKEALKAAGYKWAAKKLCWYFKPSDAGRSRSFGQFSMESIRAKYGSVAVNKRSQEKLA